MARLANIHPGEVLREEFLHPLGITAYKLSKDTDIPQTRISQIIKGKRRISADTALRLASYFGTSAKFWLGLQNDYDIEEEREAKKEILAKIKESSPSTFWLPDYRIKAAILSEACIPCLHLPILQLRIDEIENGFFGDLHSDDLKRDEVNQYFFGHIARDAGNFPEFRQGDLSMLIHVIEQDFLFVGVADGDAFFAVTQLPHF